MAFKTFQTKGVFIFSIEEKKICYSVYVLFKLVRSYNKNYPYSLCTVGPCEIISVDPHNSFVRHISSCLFVSGDTE